jgi:hypothetical protein
MRSRSCMVLLCMNWQGLFKCAALKTLTDALKLSINQASLSSVEDPPAPEERGLLSTSNACEPT